MFYSHEVLTQRKYGVATIWLVATIGSKSGLRKVHRKDILSVNVPKACETVIQPDAPLALRLQSNLLYGISRVYSGQCDYLMNDASMAHMNIKRLIRATAVKNLDLVGGRSKPDQLVLHDDPAFLPDVNLTMLPDDLDFVLDERGNMITLDESAAISSLNYERGDSVHSLGQAGFQTGSIPPGSSRHSLMIPTSDTVAGDYGFLPGESSLIGDGDEGDRFLEDVGFEFDANGEMREIETPNIPKAKDILASGKDGKERDRAFSVDRGGRLNSEDIAQQVLLEHTEARAEDLSGSNMLDGDASVYAPPDDDIFDITAEPFPPTGSGEPSKEPSKEGSASTVIAEESAPLLRKRAAKRVAPIVDNATEIRSAEMKEWRENYLKNMDAAIKKTKALRDSRKAKGNAKVMLFDIGFFGELKNPVLRQLFSTKALLEGLNASFQGRKRKGTEDSDDNERRVRARVSGGPEKEMGLAPNSIDEYDLPMEAGDNEIEVGREGLEVGNDDIRPSSQATLPWNLMSERRSRTGSVMSEGRLPSVGGFPSSSMGGSQADFHSRRGSKLSTIKGGLERLSIIGSPIGERDEEMEEGLDREPPLEEEMDFEYFGAGANVDTQTAQDSQWLAATVEHESTNFFEFVKAEQEKVNQTAEYNDEEPVSFITFEQLLSPAQNGRIVAAQAFHHTLLLATKGLVCVTQEEPYGTIQISILEF